MGGLWRIVESKGCEMKWSWHVLNVSQYEGTHKKSAPGYPVFRISRYEAGILTA
jgi:hypothetical protein